MTPHEEDRLLREILAEESLERLRAETLEAGLASIRRRRRWRALSSCAAGLLACGALAFCVFEHNREATRMKDAPTASRMSPGRPGPVARWIDDQQLLARFPGRGVAIIGQPGHQQLVFLDFQAQPKIK